MCQVKHVNLLNTSNKNWDVQTWFLHTSSVSVWTYTFWNSCHDISVLLGIDGCDPTRNTAEREGGMFEPLINPHSMPFTKDVDMQLTIKRITHCYRIVPAVSWLVTVTWVCLCFPAKQLLKFVQLMTHSFISDGTDSRSILSFRREDLNELPYKNINSTLLFFFPFFMIGSKRCKTFSLAHFSQILGTNILKYRCSIQMTGGISRCWQNMFWQKEKWELKWILIHLCSKFDRNKPFVWKECPQQINVLNLYFSWV